MQGSDISQKSDNDGEVGIIDELPPYQKSDNGKCETPIVFASPHSGRHYPAKWMQHAALDCNAIRKSEDALVDTLLASTAEYKIPLISANYARAYIDLNREPFELDQMMFEDELPTYANVRTARVAAGLGSIARVVAEGQEIYRGKLLFADARDRIEKVHQPYHHALNRLISDAVAKHGIALLVDWHSMPSVAIGGGEGAVDIVLGDRFGTSCAPGMTDFVGKSLDQQGYAVVRNAPYAGGYTTEYYGKPRVGVNALQIEMNRKLYLDEITLEPNSGFDKLASNLRSLIEKLVNLDWGRFVERD